MRMVSGLRYEACWRAQWFAGPQFFSARPEIQISGPLLEMPLGAGFGSGVCATGILHRHPPCISQPASSQTAVFQVEELCSRGATHANNCFVWWFRLGVQMPNELVIVHSPTSVVGVFYAMRLKELSYCCAVTLSKSPCRLRQARRASGSEDSGNILASWGYDGMSPSPSMRWDQHNTRFGYRVRVEAIRSICRVVFKNDSDARLFIGRDSLLSPGPACVLLSRAWEHRLGLFVFSPSHLIATAHSPINAHFSSELVNVQRNATTTHPPPRMLTLRERVCVCV
jgi:hypothetical protein